MHQILAKVCKKWALWLTQEFRATIQRAYLDVYYDATTAKKIYSITAVLTLFNAVTVVIFSKNS